MKKIIIALMGVVLLASCQKATTLERPFNLYQVGTLTATAGDNEATLTWTTLDGKPNPELFIVTWTPDAAGAEGGKQELSGDKRVFVVKDLVNDCGYTFGVQAKYASGLAQKITAKCTPKTSRFAVTGFSANAGSERVLLRWTKPETDRLSSYTITWTPGNGSQKLTDASLEQYMVNGLTNDTEYEFTLVCNYPNGDSDAVNASATPGVVSPVIMSMTEAIKYQQVTFEYNPMYFMAGEVTAVSWTFGDGGSAEGLKVVHGFSTEGTLEVKATVTYADNTSESASTEIAISGYKWSKQALSMGGYTGYVKASNPVFSPDGGMLYISTSNGQGDVFALDTWTGEIKWTFPIAKTTYGGGPVVGPDGSIYVGAQEKVFRAIKPDGTLKWSFETAGNVEAFPAITSDNKLYFVSNGSPATLYAMNATTGAAEWTKELDGGTGSAVVVDAEGNIYVGTNSAIWSFSADGSQRWKSDAINVTERGSFAIDGTTLYAGLKATAGVGAIDMSTGTIKWTSNLGTNDNYFPIVGPDGTVYYTSKGGKKIYAINPDGTKKWESPTAAALIYAGLVLTADNKLYIGTQAAIDGSRQLLTVNAADGTFTMEPSDQVMSAFTFGPDARVYYGTVAGNLCTIETVGPAASWSMRGGNIHGTNSLK